MWSIFLLILGAFFHKQEAAVLPSSVFSNETSLKIANGKVVKPHAVPYMAFVKIVENNGKLSGCGGVLISHNFVLTAGHCTEDVKHMSVLLGAHDVSIENHHVKEISVIRAAKYGDSAHDDIAVLRLTDPVKFTTAIQPATLPTRSSVAQTYEGKSGKAYGWGENEKGERSKVLLKAKMPVISRSKCKRTFGPLFKTEMCAERIHQTGTCGGDSGGPFVVNKIVVGLIKASKCRQGNLKAPSVFTRISHYFDWIEQQTDVVIKKK